MFVPSVIIGDTNLIMIIVVDQSSNYPSNQRSMLGVVPDRRTFYVAVLGFRHIIIVSFTIAPEPPFSSSPAMITAGYPVFSMKITNDIAIFDLNFKTTILKYNSH